MDLSNLDSNHGLGSMANSYCIPPKDNSLQSTKEFTDGIFEIDKDESNDFDNLMIKRSEENYESLNHNESNLSIDNNNSNFDENKNPNFFLIEPNTDMINIIIGKEKSFGEDGGSENEKGYNISDDSVINNSKNSNDNNSTNQSDDSKKNEITFASQEKESLSSGAKNDSILKRKREKKRKKRRDNADNIRRKIKRGFFNFHLFNIFKKLLRSIRSKQYIMKFPGSFVSDVDKKRNQKILNFTLKEIIENEKFYIGEEKEKFIHNSKLIKSEEIQNNKEFKEFLNKTYRQLFEEYINSNDFKVDEINRVKEKINEIKYIENYENVAKNYIRFFCN